MSTSSSVVSTQEATKSSSARIGLFATASVSGTIAAIWNLTQPEGLHRSAFLAGYAFFNLPVPIIAGLIVVMVWPRLRPAEVLLAAVCAGAAEALIEILVLQHITINQTPLAVATEDYLAWGSIACMFAAGGLYRLFRREPIAPTSGGFQRREMVKLLTAILGIVGSLLHIYVMYQKTKQLG